MGPSVGVVVYNADGKGGMERQALQLAARLRSRGARVLVISTVAPRDFRKPPVEDRGVPIHRIPTTRTPLFEWAARALVARAGGVDVLYGVHYRCGVHAVRIARGTGTPVVVKFAGGGQNGDFAFTNRQPGHERARALLGEATRFVCISEQIRREAEADGLPPERLVRIPNGVDLARFEAPALRPAALPFLPEGEVDPILYVGRLGKEKRLDVLLRAFARVLERVPRARLALAGDGAERGPLEALARELGLGERVAFLGARLDVPELHRAARAFVLCSESEGMPNALLEALAAGTPAVATAIEGVGEVVRHDREALLVPVGDEAALASALVRVLEDRALAARLVEAGRSRARDYDLDGVAARYEELFSEVAAAHPGPRWRLGALGRLALGARALARW